MPDVDSTPREHDGSDAAKSRDKAARDEIAEAVKSEQRTFAKASDDVLAAARNTGHNAAANASEAARASHDVLRKAGDQAADLWRASLDPLTNMQTEFSRWMEQTWRQGMAMRLHGGPLIGESFLAALSGAPVSDIYETEQGLTLVVDLPGLSAGDVHLSQSGDSLIITGERSETAVKDEGAYRVRERRSGAFRRIFALPPEADASHIDARFDKGVLTIAIPKTSGGGVHERDIPIKG